MVISLIDTFSRSFLALPKSEIPSSNQRNKTKSEDKHEFNLFSLRICQSNLIFQVLEKQSDRHEKKAITDVHPDKARKPNIETLLNDVIIDLLSTFHFQHYFNCPVVSCMSYKHHYRRFLKGLLACLVFSSGLVVYTKKCFEKSLISL
jgi:hypothetical protein